MVYVGVTGAIVIAVSMVLVGTVSLVLRGMSIKRLFGQPWYVVVLAADIGGWKVKRRIQRKGVVGMPDALFFDPVRLRYVIGEYKSRVWKGSVTERERYQVTLYVGMLRRLWRREPRGLIAYGCGRIQNVAFNKGVYVGLLGLRKEVLAVERDWVVKDSRPLSKR